jgi:hypothetical protein
VPEFVAVLEFLVVGAAVFEVDVAGVEFEVVDAPGFEGAGVGFFVVLGAGVLLMGELMCVLCTEMVRFSYQTASHVPYASASVLLYTTTLYRP